MMRLHQKKRRSNDRGVQFSFNIEFPKSHENRILCIKDRIKMAKSALNLTKATSSSENSDLMEDVLLALEEKNGENVECFFGS